MHTWWPQHQPRKSERELSKQISTILDRLLFASGYDNQIRPQLTGPPVQVRPNIHQCLIEVVRSDRFRGETIAVSALKCLISGRGERLHSVHGPCWWAKASFFLGLLFSPILDRYSRVPYFYLNRTESVKRNIMNSTTEITHIFLNST